MEKEQKESSPPQSSAPSTGAGDRDPGEIIFTNGRAPEDVLSGKRVRDPSVSQQENLQLHIMEATIHNYMNAVDGQPSEDKFAGKEKWLWDSVSPKRPKNAEDEDSEEDEEGEENLKDAMNVSGEESSDDDSSSIDLDEESSVVSSSSEDVSSSSDDVSSSDDEPNAPDEPKDSVGTSVTKKTTAAGLEKFEQK